MCKKASWAVIVAETPGGNGALEPAGIPQYPGGDCEVWPDREKSAGIRARMMSFTAISVELHSSSI
jgi:hypothetical protein